MSKYHIICLSETWTSKGSNVDLKGYNHKIHSFRIFRHRKAKRPSGGIIIYIKDNVSKGIQLIKNEVDCIVWLKCDKHFFQLEQVKSSLELEHDIYIGVIYIAPESSPVYNVYDFDIFRKLVRHFVFQTIRSGLFNR